MKINDNVEMSLARGITFKFDDGGVVIVYRQVLSGRETVEVDGVLTSATRNFALSSQHEFQVGKSKYRIAFDTKTARRGPWECSLSRDGVLVVMYRILPGKPERRFAERVVLPMIVGGVAALAVVMRIAPFWIIPSAIGAVFVFALLRNLTHPTCEVVGGQASKAAEILP